MVHSVRLSASKARSFGALGFHGSCKTLGAFSQRIIHSDIVIFSNLIIRSCDMVLLIIDDSFVGSGALQVDNSFIAFALSYFVAHSFLVKLSVDMIRSNYLDAIS